MQRADTTGGYYQREELSYSLSNFHCFFIVMSEEVIGLVWFHRFSPIDAKVEHCTGRESRQRGQRHAEAIKTVADYSRWWPSSQRSPSNRFCRPRALLVPQHNPKQCCTIRRVDKNWIGRHCIAPRTRFLFHWTASQASSRTRSAWSCRQTHITKSFTEALDPVWTWVLLVFKGYSEHEHFPGTDPLLALRSSWGSASASWTCRFFPWQANRSSLSQLVNWSCRMPKLQFAQTTTYKQRFSVITHPGILKDLHLIHKLSHVIS